MRERVRERERRKSWTSNRKSTNTMYNVSSKGEGTIRSRGIDNDKSRTWISGNPWSIFGSIEFFDILLSNQRSTAIVHAIDLERLTLFLAPDKMFLTWGSNDNLRLNTTNISFTFLILEIIVRVNNQLYDANVRLLFASSDRDYFSYIRVDRLMESLGEIPDERSSVRREKKRCSRFRDSLCEKKKNPENTSEPTTDQWRKKREIVKNAIDIEARDTKRETRSTMSILPLS